MIIVNQLEQLQSVNQSLNTALHQSQQGQFSLLLSLLTTPLYAADVQGVDSSTQVDLQRMNLEADTQARHAAMVVNSAFNRSVAEGHGGYFSFLRALSDVYPNLQQVTAVRTARASKVYQVADAPKLGEQLTQQINLAA